MSGTQRRKVGNSGQPPGAQDSAGESETDVFKALEALVSSVQQWRVSSDGNKRRKTQSPAAP